MGIKGLKKYLKPVIQSKVLNDYKNQKVAIDTSIYMYKFKYSNPKNYINLFKLQLKTLNKFDITPIYVFDNKSNELKKSIIDERKQKFQTRELKINELIEQVNAIDDQNNLIEIQEQIQNLKKNHIRINKEDIENVKELLNDNNIEYIDDIEGDAEAICGRLNKDNQVDFVMTADIDSIVYGCKEVVLNFNTKDVTLEVLKIDDILNYLELSQDSFIEMCIMIGCDFFKGIHGYGPKKAHKFVKNGNSKKEEFEEIFNIFKNC